MNSSSYMSTPSVVRVGTKKKEVPKPTTETGKKTTKAEDKARCMPALCGRYYADRKSKREYFKTLGTKTVA